MDKNLNDIQKQLKVLLNYLINLLFFPYILIYINKKSI